MKKRILSVLMAIVMLIGMVPTAFAATPKVKISIEASKTTPSKGEEITFTLSIQTFEDGSVSGFTLPIDVPSGLTYIANSGKVDEGFKSVAKAEGFEWIEAEQQFFCSSSALDGLSGLTTKRVIGTFKCVVSNEAIGVYNVGVSGSVEDKNVEPITGNDLLIEKATVTIPKAPITSVSAKVDAPQKGVTLDTSVDLDSATAYTGAVEWYKGDTAAGTAVTGPAAANQVYTAKITLTAKTTDGESFDASLDGKTTAEGYKIKFVGTDKLELTKTFDATAIKDTPSITTVPTASAITYGQKLSNSTLSGGDAKVGSTVISGTFKWKTSSTAPEVKDSNVTEYEVVFTPTDTASYETTTCKVKLTVNKKSLSSISIIPIDPQPYTGLEIKPDVTVKDGQPPYNPLAKSDYSVAYSNNKDVGTANYTIEETPTGNYKFNTGHGTFEIKKADSSISITSAPGKTYDGNVVADPAVSTSGSTGTVTYTYYTNATCTTETTTANSGAASNGTAPKNAGDYWVKATLAADSNYGSATSVAKKFTISQKALTNDMIILGTQATYDGTAHGPAYSVKDGATTLNKDIDYTETSGHNPVTNVGNTTLKISGAGNYTGTAQKDWSLVAKDVTITPDAKSKTYGAADPELTYSTDLTAGSALETAFNTAKSGALSYTGTNVGAYIIGIGTLKAGNNFNLKMNATAVFFKINQATPVITATTPRQLVNNGVEVDISNWATFTNTDSGAELTYTLGSAPAGITLAGNKLKAASSVAAGATFEIKVNAYGTHNFTAPTEFTINVTVVNKENAGVSITTPSTSKTYGDANFTVTATKTALDGGTWKWTSSDDTVLKIVAGADSATATVQVLKASATGATLTVTYESDTHMGTATTAIIKVNPKDVTAAMIAGIPAQTYTGSAIQPKPAVKDGVALVEGTDFTYSYDVNTNVATGGKVTITGQGNYKGTADKTFTISPKNINGATIDLTAASLPYNGSEQTVSITSVTLTGWTPTINTGDYKIQTGTNSHTSAGNYTLIIDGQGNYTGTASVGWKITKVDPKLADFGVSPVLSAAQTYDGAHKTVTVVPKSGVNGMGTVKVYYEATAGITYPKSETAPTDVGTYKVTASVAAGSNYNAKDIDVGTLTINQATGGTLAAYNSQQKYTDLTAKTITPDYSDLPAGQTWTYSTPTPTTSGTAAVTDTSIGADTGVLSYTLTAGAKDNTVKWTVTISSHNYADFTKEVTLTLTDKDDQAALTLTGGTTVVYGQTLQLGTTGGSGTGAVTYAVTNGTGEATIDATGKLTPTKAGTVTVTATKAADANYNPVTSAPVTITITKATPAGTPGYTAITAEGKTLADAGLTVGTITPAGTIKWVAENGADLADNTAVEANKSYSWVFTPTDTANYETLTGSIQLWHKSTGGRYYYSSSNSSGTATITAVLTAKDAKSATDYTSGIYGLTFRSTADFSGFKGVKVDGKTIGKDNYVAESNNGSIEVYLKAAYLKTLAVGRHTLTIMATGGNASIDFTIGGVNTAPKTFDAGIAVYVTMAVASVTGMAWMGKKRED